MSNTAAIIPSIKARLAVQERPIPSPQGSELLIKNRALATNPVDWKIQDYGLFVTKYPNILGSDISGTVEAIGPDVKLFKKGDRVTGYAASNANGDINHGAFQQYSLLNENVTTKLPDDITFEEGAILPMSIATAGVAIFLDLAVPRVGKQSGAFLVWGASSSVGSAAVQIARSLGLTVYAVCSPRHHPKVREYGASHVFDYNDANVITNIVQAAKQNTDTIKLSFDAISEGTTPEQVASILNQQGGGKMAMTLPFPESAKKPDNVEISAALAFRVNTDAKDFGAWLFNEWLAKSLAEKTYIPSPEIEKVEGGISSVQKALDLHRKGLSGKKLVVPLA
ncbi:MAG: hypothetical protein LQ343_004166 [Gyalolechia ehrenbergii]|nr:MAG: hypothetical protein LQ343_004166 [Gyalolechia ehrenbergii]